MSESGAVESRGEDLQVVDVPEQGRFEIRSGGTVLGFAEYREEPDGRVVMPHTVIDPAQRGRGLGEILVAEAVDELEGRGLEIVPVCWFVAQHLESRSS